jgi:hypothetical protein
MNTGHWWWDMQDQLSAGATIVAVICAYDKTHWTISSGNLHASLWNLTMGTVRKDLRHTLIKRGWILFGLIPSSPDSAKYTDNASHSAVGTVLAPLRNLDITGPSLRSNFADGFQGQCCHLLAACVGDYPEQIMIAQVSYGSCPMSAIPNVALL